MQVMSLVIIEKGDETTASDSSHLPEVQLYIFVENLTSKIYLVAFNRHGPFTIAIPAPAIVLPFGYF